MTDDNVTPDDLVTFFRQLRDLADAGLARAEAAAGTAGAVTAHAGVAEGTGQALPPTVVRAAASLAVTFTATASAEVIPADRLVAEASVLAALLESAAALGTSAWAAAQVLDVIEGCISLAQRLIGIGN